MTQTTEEKKQNINQDRRFSFEKGQVVRVHRYVNSDGEESNCGVERYSWPFIAVYVREEEEFGTVEVRVLEDSYSVRAEMLEPVKMKGIDGQEFYPKEGMEVYVHKKQDRTGVMTDGERRNLITLTDGATWPFKGKIERYGGDSSIVVEDGAGHSWMVDASMISEVPENPTTNGGFSLGQRVRITPDEGSPNPRLYISRENWPFYATIVRVREGQDTFDIRDDTGANWTVTRYMMTAVDTQEKAEETAGEKEETSAAEPEDTRTKKELRELLDEANAEKTRLLRLVREHDEWKDQLTQDAHDMADRYDWCDDFDDFMEEHGLARRRREYDVTIELTVQTVVRVEAENEDEAEYEADETYLNMDEIHRVESALVGVFDRDYVDVTDTRVISAEIA